MTNMFSGQTIRKGSIYYLNIMVVGASGVGKTTFVRRFYHHVRDNILEGTFKKQITATTATTAAVVAAVESEIIIKEEKEEKEEEKKKEEPLKPTKEPYTITMHLGQKTKNHHHERICLSILDTPGWNQTSSSSSIDQQLDYFINYIDRQYERTFIEETKLKRDIKISDSHIHACIFFLDPTTCTNGFTDIDLQILKHLSKRVHVIPIIGKADIIPMEQLNNLKRNFRRFLFDVYKYPLYGFVHLDDDSDDPYDNGDHIGCLNESIPGSKIIDQIIEALAFYSKGDNNNNNDNNNDNDYEEEEVLTMIDYLKYMPFHIIDQSTTIPIIQSNHCQFDKLMDLLLLKHRDLLRIDTFKRFYEKYRIDKLLKQQIYDMITIKSRGKKLPLI